MNSTFLRRTFLAVLWNVGTYGGVLFATAGTLDWWRAWVLVAVIAIGSLATMLLVFRTRPELLQERMKGVIQKEQPTTDRVIMIVFLLTFGGAIAFIPLDVFRLHVLPKPPVWVSSLGLGIAIFGWCVISLVFRENAFAAPVVKHQSEREHHIVDSGVYRIVRHPMYAGITLFNLGIALWLESYAGAIATLIPASVLAIRIVFEEKFLRRTLPAYSDYAERVRYRLVPFVW